MVFLDRSRRAGPYLEWKVRIFAVAAVVALAGIYLDERWLTGVAIALLFGGLALRFLPEGGPDPEDGSRLEPCRSDDSFGEPNADP